MLDDWSRVRNMAFDSKTEVILDEFYNRFRNRGCALFLHNQDIARRRRPSKG